MGHRTIKRVPLDFAHPIGEVWPGYLVPDIAEYRECPRNSSDGGHYRSDCPVCHGQVDFYEMPDGTHWAESEPPAGEGYQLWETTSEGSPVSPVFERPMDLAIWCAEHATIFASERLPREDWYRLIVGEDDLETGSLGMAVITPEGNRVSSVYTGELPRNPPFDL